MTERTEPSAATKAADEEEAQAAHVAGGAASEEEAAAADEAREELGDELASVGEHEREMNKAGAEVKGEGAVP